MPKKEREHKNKYSIFQANVSPKQSPIDLVPVITAFDPALENAAFGFQDESNQLLVQNLGSQGGLCIRWPPFGPADQVQSGGHSTLTVSFLPDQQFQLEQLIFHWGTEPMNGSLVSDFLSGIDAVCHLLSSTQWQELAMQEKCISCIAT
jgi:hypothetical protein